jgi:hypothetical protein
MSLWGIIKDRRERGMQITVGLVLLVVAVVLFLLEAFGVTFEGISFVALGLAAFAAAFAADRLMPSST